MKRRLAIIPVLAVTVVMSLSSLAVLLPSFGIGSGTAYADNIPTDGPFNALLITLKGTSTDASKYSLKGVTGNGASVSFSYVKSQNAFASSNLGNTSEGCETSTQTIKADNNITVTASLNGTKLVTQDYDICGQENGYYYEENMSVPSTPQQTGCFEVNGAYYTSDADGSKIDYTSDATATLVPKNGSQNYTLTFDGNGNIAKKCNIPAGDYTFKVDYNPTDPSVGVTDRTISQAVTISKGKTSTLNKPAGQGGTASTTASGSGSSSGSSGSVTLTCESIGSSLTWILCPVLELFDGMVNTIDNLITSLLDINANSIYCSKTSSSSEQQTCAGYYTAWSSFRDLALGLMVIAGLVMVIANALGAEIMDAYTIRKVAPRILIAAIGITLSWSITKFMIEFSNELGFGIRHLIYAPFSGMKDSFGFGFGGGGGGILNGLLGVFTGAGIALAGVAMFGIILSLLGTAALAVFVAILVLMLRQIAIILLVLLAPIAIVMYILPNTERTYKLWWESFSKALMMFPIISGFIAAGRVFSTVSLNAGHDILHEMIGFIAYFAPYFLIPATFQLAGGAVRQLGGFVNDRSRGGFDRLRNQRANKMKTYGERAKSGELFEGKSWIPGSQKVSNAVNTAALGAGTGYRGRYGFGERGRTARSNALARAAAEKEKDPALANMSGNNLANRALAMGMGDSAKGKKAVIDHLMAGGDDGNWGSEFRDTSGRIVDQAGFMKKANETADNAVKQAGGVTRFTKAAGIAAARNMARDGTAIRDTDDLAQIAASVGDGNYGNTYRYAAEMASLSRQPGRGDLAAGATQISDLALLHAGIKAPDVQRKQDGTMETQMEANERVRATADQSGTAAESMYMLMNNGKATAVKNNVNRNLDILHGRRKNALGEYESHYYTDKERDTAAAKLTEVQQAVDSGQGRRGNIDTARDIIGGASGQILRDYLGGPSPRAGYDRDAVVHEQTEQKLADGKTPRYNADGQKMYTDTSRPREKRDDIAEIVGRAHGPSHDDIHAAGHAAGEEHGTEGS